MASTDIHQHLLNVSGDPIVDVSTARQWVVPFCSGDDSVCSLLLQASMNAVCRLLFKDVENAQLMVVTMLQNSILQLKMCSIK